MRVRFQDDSVGPCRFIDRLANLRYPTAISLPTLYHLELCQHLEVGPKWQGLGRLPNKQFL